MIEMLSEAWEEPAFWLLAGGGTIALVLGWIMSKKMELQLMPLWQMLIILATIVIASAYFSTKD